MRSLVGRAEYEGINARLNRALRHRPLIACHRGAAGGSIAENTSEAVVAASHQGADIVEIDVATTADGVDVVFHTGYEPMSLGIDDDLSTLTAAEVDRLMYRWVDETGRTKVERLADLVASTGDVLLNVDRSWDAWPGLLDRLAALDVTDRILLKSNVDDDRLGVLEDHPAGFPYFPMVTSVEEIDRVLSRGRLNLVGFELIAETPDHLFCDRRLVADLQAEGFFVWLNALVLAHRRPLYAGFDDEVSLLDSPDLGWGEILARRPDVIHTDWPAALLNHLVGRGIRRLR